MYFMSVFSRTMFNNKRNAESRWRQTGVDGTVCQRFVFGTAGFHFRNTDIGGIRLAV
jgi:hypothetical protein